MKDRVAHMVARLAGRAKYQAADRIVLALHRDVLQYEGVTTSATLKVTSRARAQQLSFLALHVMASDLVALDQVVFELCRDGWAYACPIVLRTELDILLSAGAITNAGANAEYMAFKYLFVSTQKYLRQADVPKAKKVRERKQAEEYIGRLVAADQARARTFMSNGKVPAYWYGPEFANPRALIKALGSPSVQEIYDWLSGAAHGGMMGLRMWRDIPDDQAPTPRADRAAQNRALGISSKLVLDFTELRARFLGLPALPMYTTLVQQHQALRPVIEASFAEAMTKAEAFAQRLAQRRQSRF